MPMTNSNGARNMPINGRPSALPPKIPFPYTSSSSYSEFIPREEGRGHHHRTSSENFLIDEKPSWLDDLLDEPESPLRKSGHRRSSSDSFAYHVDSNSESRYYSLFDSNSQKTNAIQNGWKGSKQVPRSNETRDLIIESIGSNATEAETKRNKQQYAQRSRVRKLQYIAELERNVQALQAEGCDTSAELEFVNRKVLILSMENKALKQRLENLAQEQLIKYMEHEMLEREVGRLRNLFQRQQQKNSKTLHNNHQNHADNDDLDRHFSALSVNPSDS